MTVVLSSGVPSFLTFPQLDHNSDGMNDVWQRQYCPEMSLPAMNHYWPESQGLSVQDMDVRFSGQYEPSITNDGGPLISPPMSGCFPESNWGSNIDIGTPSTTAGFTSETMDGYHNLRHITGNPGHHLNLPASHGHVPTSASAWSPQSSHDGISPNSLYDIPVEPVIKKEERPSLVRSVTAPEPLPRRSIVVGSSGTPSVKRSGSEDEDDDYMPNCEETKPRGRKRQRIPHTAVERRYRENLNAHLHRLRQTVPSLASTRAAGASKSGDGIAEGVKPSKCEILTGAIEHIGALGKENSALQTEVKALRSRLEDLERFVGAHVK